MTATDRSAQHGRHSRKRPAIFLAAAAAVIAGLIASLAIALSPQRDANTGYAATAVPTRAIAAHTTSAAPTASSITTPPSASPGPTTATPSPQPTATATSKSQGTSTGTSLAGLVQPGVIYNGVATEYAAADGDGACLFGPSSDMMIAAMNVTDYQESEACGAHIVVHASDGASVTVLITNECPAPCAPGQLDLSQQAFAKIADPSAGRVSVTWELISPSDAGTLSIRYKTGSSQWWCGIQVIGERNPVARIEVSTSSGWHQLSPTGYNYFLSTDGTGCGHAIRITDIYGQQLITGALTVQPNVIQSTDLQFAEH